LHDVSAIAIEKCM